MGGCATEKSPLGHKRLMEGVAVQDPDAKGGQIIKEGGSNGFGGGEEELT